MLCSFALYSQCWEVVVYQEMICILALGQKYGTCNYVRERQNLLTRKTKAIKVSGCVLIKLLCGWAFCLKLHREFSGKIKTKTHTSESSAHFCQSAEVVDDKHVPTPRLARLGFQLMGRKLHVHPWHAQSQAEFCDADQMHMNCHTDRPPHRCDSTTSWARAFCICDPAPLIFLLAPAAPDGLLQGGLHL